MTCYADISLEGLRGVLIDLDDTLYVYAPAHEAALRGAHAASPVAMSLEDFSEHYRRARTEVEQRLLPQGACRSRLFGFQAMFEALNVPLPYIPAAALDRVYWRSFIDAMIPDPAAFAFLRRCKAAGVPVCIVSDMLADIQVEKILKLGMQDYLPHLVTSEEIGAEKPDPRMFEAGLRKTGATAATAIMIGDNEAKDIAGAAPLGMRAFLIPAGKG